MKVALIVIVALILIGLVAFRVITTKREKARVAAANEAARREAQSIYDKEIAKVRTSRIADSKGKTVNNAPYTPPAFQGNRAEDSRYKNKGAYQPKAKPSKRLSDDDISTRSSSSGVDFTATYLASTYTYDDTPSRSSYSGGYSGGSSSYDSGSSSSYSSGSDSSSYSGGSDSSSF